VLKAGGNAFYFGQLLLSQLLKWAGAKLPILTPGEEMKRKGETKSEAKSKK